MIDKSILRNLNLLLAAVLLWGCGARIGPATKEGAYLNLDGEVVNAYPAAMDRTVQVGLQVLESMGASVADRREGQGVGTILATTPDGSPLKLHFVAEGRNLTTVAVRSGVADYWDHEFSHQVHRLIHERLERRTNPSPSRARRPPPKDAAGVDADRTAAGRSSPPRGATASRAVPSTGTDPDAIVYFERDSNLPGEGEIGKLETIAHKLLANPSWGASLHGYADADENSGRPLTIAENRALAVKFFFVGKGIDAARIDAAARKTTDNHGGHDMGGNRRVDIRLLTK